MISGTNYYELTKNRKKAQGSLREQGVGGSNPPTPTILTLAKFIVGVFFVYIPEKMFATPRWLKKS